MPNLEPTYLRYVYDGLNKGSLNAENAAALPQGFIGLYEQVFTQKTPTNERQKVLNQLALWALFKGPVSANMAAAVLELEEEQMKDLVDTYSSWFNSPESGKYQLYHERLRVYLLQKLKADEVQALNEKLISFLEHAVKQAKGQEDEYYALAHLHQHMALESQLGNHYERLHSYVNQESLWRRQIQLSKSYDWSQNALQQVIKEGARRNHEMNTIRSTVNSVKLMTQEQNSAEDILNLLNEGDYPAALKRAENWEGERQFKLYLLFIHELTIGTSKEADFRKEACKAVLDAIDQTPEDHSVLDWCKFYPELAIYKYHEEFTKMELDGMVIWRRGNYTLGEFANLHQVNINDLIDLATSKKDIYFRDRAILEIIRLLSRKNDLGEEVYDLVDQINDEFWSSKAYYYIILSLLKNGNIEDSLALHSFIKNDLVMMEVCLATSHSYPHLDEKTCQDFMEIANDIANDLEYSKKIIAESNIKILNALYTQNNLTKEECQIQEIIKITNDLLVDDFNDEKSEVLIQLVRVLIEHLKLDRSLSVIQEIRDDVLTIEAFLDLAFGYIRIDQKTKAETFIYKGLKKARSLKSAHKKNEVYSYISKFYLDIGKSDYSLKFVNEISDDLIRSEALINVLSFYCLESRNHLFRRELIESLKIDELLDYSVDYIALAKLQFENKKIDDLISSISHVDDENKKLILIRQLINNSTKSSNFEFTSRLSELLTECLSVSKNINDLTTDNKTKLTTKQITKMFESISKIESDYPNFDKAESYRDLSDRLFEINEMDFGVKAVNNAISFAKKLGNDYSLMDEQFYEICLILTKHKQFQLALKTSDLIDEKILNSSANCEIFCKIMICGEATQAFSILKKITFTIHREWALRFCGSELGFRKIITLYNDDLNDFDRVKLLEGVSDKLKSTMMPYDYLFPYLTSNHLNLYSLKNVLRHLLNVHIFYLNKENKLILSELMQVVNNSSMRN